MALNPQYLDSLPQTLVDMYSLVEIDILEDMARRISTYDYFIPAALHQNQKLQELGLTQQYIIEALAGMTGQTQQEIVDLLSEASAEAVADDVEYYTRAEVYKPDEVNTESLHKQLNSGLLQTQQAFKNITRTTANTATKQFENALDRAWTQINVGGMDYNTAIYNAIKDLSKAGVGAIAYKSGRVDSLEVAVRRAVVTGANQTAAKVQETLADELGVDLVEVTAHGGARPDHAKWQGKCYSRKGRQVIEGVVYEDFEKATRYGHGDGLGGWNCRHNFHPYVHGAPRTWTDKQIKALDKKNIEYNGKKYTEYEASQIQRGVERDIRSLKRQIAAIEAGGGDASAERAKLRKANKAYTDFTEQTGLKKQTARTKIATGTGTEKPAPSTPTNSTNVKFPTKKDIQKQREQESENKAFTIGDEYISHNKKINKALYNIERDAMKLKDKEHGAILDIKGNVLWQSEGSAHSVQVKDDSLLNNAIFTHNHPGGGCFTAQDIESAVGTNVYELRASTPDGRYFSLRRTGKIDESIVADVRAASKISDASERVRQKVVKGEISKDEFAKKGFLLSVEEQSYMVDEFLQKNADKYGFSYTKGEIDKSVLTNNVNKDIIKLDVQMFAEKDIKKQSTNSLKKGITSYDKRINEHQKKIDNPQKFIEDWDKKDVREQNGLVKHWKKEIKNFQTSKNDRIEELKERGEYNE